MAAVEATIAKESATDRLPRRAGVAGRDATPRSTRSFTPTCSASAFGAHLTGLMFGLVPFYPDVAGQRARSRSLDSRPAAGERRSRAVGAANQGDLRQAAAHNELRRVDAFEQEAGQICARHARCADLTVLGWSRDGGSDIERALFDSCLFESGRPLLVVPAAYAFRGHAATRAGRLERQPRGESRRRMRRCRCCGTPA